jgi:hypothetical protein
MLDHDKAQLEPTAGPRHSIEDYTVGWICALSTELTAARAMLDDNHPKLPAVDHAYNIYHFGSIEGHNAVIACLPSGTIGNNSAAGVATEMRVLFKSIKIRLMVGTAGGVPSKKNDIRLGDVVVSDPTGLHGGVVQYDFGKEETNEFQRNGTLNLPLPLLRSALATVKSNHALNGSNLSKYLSAALDQYPHLIPTSIYPGATNDRLFKPESIHREEDNEDCERCDTNGLVTRPERTDNTPVVH